MVDWYSGATGGPSRWHLEKAPVRRSPLPVATTAKTQPPLAEAPFRVAEARERQEAWARDLGVEAQVTNTLGMVLRFIPPGEFTMGSPEGEGERRFWEGPEHRVRITRPFYLGAFAVTQEEFAEVQGANPSYFRDYRRPQGPVTWDTATIVEAVRDWEGERRPVESVSWEEAAAWCRRLSAREGQTYRLPTEGEWEYACRAGSEGGWCCEGAARVGEYAWFGDNAGGTTHAVGEKCPNAWGLYDVHGNVWEWCADWFSSRYYVQSPSLDPAGPRSGRARVLRGGGWSSDAANCRSAARDYYAPHVRDRSLGFRVVLVPTG